MFVELHTYMGYVQFVLVICHRYLGSIPIFMSSGFQYKIESYMRTL